MKIISHRGFWIDIKEKNIKEAFIRSFSLGFGTETDLRDFNQELVISHDMPTLENFKLKSVLEWANASDLNLTLALNIKSDGLATAVKKLLNRYEKLDCFAFDMSIPDMLDYKRNKVPFFTRLSEIEPFPAICLNEACGVWLDAFYSEWYDEKFIKGLLEQGKKVCIVSSELHKRKHLPLWNLIASLKQEDNLMLCTDFPTQAQAFFN